MICGEKYVTIKDLYSEEKRVEFKIFSTLLSFSLFYATSHFYSTLFFITLAYVFVTVVSDYDITFCFYIIIFILQHCAVFMIFNLLL